MMEKTKYFEFYPGNTRKTLQQLTLFSKHCIHHLKVSFKEWGNVIWNYTISDQRFPHGAVLPCEGCILATVWRCFWLSPWEGQLLASSGWKSGLLLNLLQSSGPTAKTCLAQNVGSAEAEKSYIGLFNGIVCILTALPASQCSCTVLLTKNKEFNLTKKFNERAIPLKYSTNSNVHIYFSLGVNCIFSLLLPEK